MTALIEEERATVGGNIAFYRRVQGLTQTDLAERSGLDRRTVYEVERGRPVRRHTIELICQALSMKATEMMNSRHLPKPVDGSRPFFVHRHAEDHWYTPGPLPSGHGDDYQSRIQSAEERRRLGRLGFAPSFRHALSFVMPKGPGIVVYEIHARLRLQVFTHLYENWVLFCHRGSVQIELQDEETTLEEGDVLAAQSWEGLTVQPASLQEADPIPVPVPVIVAIGANRPGKVR